MISAIKGQTNYKNPQNFNFKNKNVSFESKLNVSFSEEVGFTIPTIAVFADPKKIKALKRMFYFFNKASQELEKDGQLDVIGLKIQKLIQQPPAIECSLHNRTTNCVPCKNLTFKLDKKTHPDTNIKKLIDSINHCKDSVSI